MMINEKLKERVSDINFTIKQHRKILNLCQDAIKEIVKHLGLELEECNSICHLKKKDDKSNNNK